VILAWSTLWLLLGIAFCAVLVLALLAPLEALAWYAGWRPRRAYERRGGAAPGAAAPAAGTPEPEHYAVFLSGIGDPSAQWHYPEETEFLRRLRARLPATAVISDLFAYSITAGDIRTTARRRLTGKAWDGIEQAVRGNQAARIGALINLRNLLQVAVSVDHRYGPFFNLGQAENVRDALLAHGYTPGSRRGVFLIGYSGGAQISLGLAAYLETMLGAPVTVISVGGVMSSEAGCLQVQHLYHLWGTKDPIQKLGDLAFFGRWPLASSSAWNRARQEGKITRVAMGPTAHNGAGGYFGPEPLPDGWPRIDLTLETVLPIITGGDVGVLPPVMPPRPGDPPAAAPEASPPAGVSKS
jgi:hypothetical protein